LLYAVISVVVRISVYFEITLGVAMLEVYEREKKIVILAFKTLKYNFNLKGIEAKSK